VKNFQFDNSYNQDPVKIENFTPDPVSSEISDKSLFVSYFAS